MSLCVCVCVCGGGGGGGGGGGLSLKSMLPRSLHHQPWLEPYNEENISNTHTYGF